MTIHIAPFPFKELFLQFKADVEKRSGMPFHSFKGNKYTDDQEGFKDSLFKSAGEALAIETWKPEDIGTGKIAKHTVEAIELPYNNFFAWDLRYGSEGRLHKVILNAATEEKNRLEVESCLYDIYRTDEDEAAYTQAIRVFGKKYPLLAYLFFLKDCSRYVPVEPQAFDYVFPLFGAEFKTAGQCSWKNYSEFIGLISELRDMLAENLDEVTLLDAHSFAWMVRDLPKTDSVFSRLQEYFSLGPKDRLAFTKARNGQGPYRQRVLEFWQTCAVTGCSKQSILEAAHIKPWRAGTAQECFSFYNGLLLTPNLHQCLDKGYITFSETGEMLISDRLSNADCKALGLEKTMRLRMLEPGHKPFLDYHRTWYAELHASK